MRFLREKKRPKWHIWLIVGLLSAAALAVGGFWAWRQPLPEPAPPSSVMPTDPPVTEARTVRVTIPEGKRLDEIAALMETNRVCSAAEFYRAEEEGDFSGYAFIREMPDMPGRGFRLEGYLFPDTYEFYINCSGESAIERFLDNFSTKIALLREAIAERGGTVDETVVMASVIQREVGIAADMRKVSRVLYNRLENPAEFPQIQCDATGDYVRKVNAAGQITIRHEDYNTYQCRGRPAGPISSPGLEALTAAVYPSEEETVRDCFFFATDIATGITYFTKTYAEHVAVCEQYQIGIHAN
ncbi:MAG: endolytic transglycosylase MltG [Oscillospiraceae bacterium]|nr:endolytic transglycosylase MltG [Oscillospiraceae bacterium]